MVITNKVSFKERNLAQKPGKQPILPIFDDSSHFKLEPEIPGYLSYDVPEKDYIAAHAFLRAYRDIKTTYNTYRRVIEQFLHITWNQGKSVFELSGYDIENHVRTCQAPPLAWIGIAKPPRFVEKNGQRVPNGNWRPFVATVSKIDARQGKKPKKKNYQLSQKAVKEIFAVLSSFYNFSIQEQFTLVNPVLG